jgi:hypothetical protein
VNSGTKYTLIIAVVLLAAAVMPALAFIAGLVILGMGLHSLLGSGTTMPLEDYDRIDQQTARQIKNARRRLDNEL